MLLAATLVYPGIFLCFASRRLLRTIVDVSCAAPSKCILHLTLVELNGYCCLAACLFAVFGTIRYLFHHHEVPLMLRDMQACKWPDAFGKFHPAAMVKKSTWMLGNTLKMKKLLRKKGFDSLLSALWHFLPNLKPCQQSRLTRMLYQECDPLEGCHWEVSVLGPLCSIKKQCFNDAQACLHTVHELTSSRYLAILFLFLGRIPSSKQTRFLEFASSLYTVPDTPLADKQRKAIFRNFIFVIVDQETKKSVLYYLKLTTIWSKASSLKKRFFSQMMVSFKWGLSLQGRPNTFYINTFFKAASLL